MRKRIAKSLLAAMLITTLTGTTVAWADDVNNIKKKQQQNQTELDQLKDDMAYLLVQMDELEVKMHAKTDEIDQANNDLAAAEEKQQSQYQDMKLRIKYMYEDQSVSISEVLLSSDNMGDVLNKAEYVQQVYNYDRTKLQEMAQTATDIKNLKSGLEKDKEELDSYQEDLTSKQALLYTTIAEKESQGVDLADQLKKAQAAAAAQTIKNNSFNMNYTAANDNATAQKVINLAYSQIGIPYVSGGKSPNSGFDCSGLMYYIFGQAGIYVSPSSGSIAWGGSDVGGLSNALPGDIICYPGHVALYIGGGQIIHAPVPGKTVQIASATGLGMGITAVRRYW